MPPPPWHYSGDFLVAEYRKDPAAVTALLPGELEPAEDPGAVAGTFADWQWRTDDGHERADPTVNDPPMHNTRHFPAYDGWEPDVLELMRAGGFDREATEVSEGDAELTLYPNTIEDLQAIAPREVLTGFRFSFGYTVSGGEVVAQHAREPVSVGEVPA